MAGILFSNYTLEEDTNYILYIGELKNFGLYPILTEALSRIYNKKFEVISIVPDVFEQYNFKNIIVINPVAESVSSKSSFKLSCRIPGGRFMSCVSENEEIRNLARELVKRQGKLYICMHESKPQMTLDTIEGVSILGPRRTIAHKANDKLFQYTSLKDIVPIADFKVCKGLDELVSETDSLWEEWSDGIYATAAYSAAGMNSIKAFKTKELTEKFKKTPDDDFLISRYIPHECDPTVLAVVANEEDVYIAGVADQRISGTSFFGSLYPSVLPVEIQEETARQTREVGKWLGRQGYRGIFGCDYMVTEDGKVYFIEINARKQGTTLEFCCALEHLLPKGAPLLPELEYYAVTQNKFLENTVEPKIGKGDIHWGTHNYKIKKTIRTDGYIPHNARIRDRFAKVGQNNIDKDFLIMEHIGNDFVVASGSFLARVVALGKNRESVMQGLKQGCRTVELTIVEQEYDG